MPAILLLFFASGACGLVYQVVWVREFGNLFGNTVHSAALVTSIFMLGLGIGSWGFGRRADRIGAGSPHRLLRTYGRLEIGVGALALVLAVLLPGLEPLSPSLASYVAGEHGWSELSAASQAFRYAGAVAILLPSTILMGGTLTLLIRHRVRSDLSAAGWGVGLLYGVNTLGAAVGAFLVDAALIPAAGLLATQALCATTNLAIGAVALRLAAREEAGGPAPGPPVPDDPKPRAAWMRPTPEGASAGAALFLSGFAALGFEIAWFRILAAVLGGHRATFSMLLSILLVGMGLGSLAGAALDRRVRRPTLLFAASQAAFVVSVLAILATFRPSWLPVAELWPALAAAGPAGRWAVQSWSQVRVILVVVGLPSFLMGFTFPLANAHVQRVASRVGRRAGALYLFNTLGAVAGSLVAGFVLLPGLGTQATILAMAACALAAPLPLLATGAGPGTSWRVRAAGLALVGAGAAAAVAWAGLPPFALARNLFTPVSPDEALLSFSEGINETIVVTEAPDTGARRLYTNNYSMSTTRPSAARYMRAFAHVPLLMADAPDTALVICFGVGNTANAASLHPGIRRLDVVDLSRHVLEHGAWFERWNHGVLRDPRVRVFVNDGRQHLRMEPPDTYDLVTLEPPPIGFAGVSALYSREFYGLVAGHLKDGGYLTQWLPAYQLPGPLVLSLVRAFLDVFPDAVLLSGSEAELILMGRKGGPAVFDPDLVARRLAERPGVAADLRAVGFEDALDLAAMFASSAATLRAATRESEPVTDDLPLIEYGPVGFRETLIPESLFDVADVGSWCPACVAPGNPDAAGFAARMAGLVAKYRSVEWRFSTNRPKPGPGG